MIRLPREHVKCCLVGERYHHGGTAASQAAGAGGRWTPAGERDLEEGIGVFRPGGAGPATEVMVTVIDAYRNAYGVEPICAVWPSAPSCSTTSRLSKSSDNVS